MHINGQTRIVAVLGHPVAHTASPAMHNAAFDALGMNWRYVALDVPPRDLAPALRGLAAAGLAGVNLTVPHKIMALRMLSRCDPTARHLQAANTVVFSRGKLHGFNTDGHGLLAALREEFGFHPRGRTIAIVGCGGAGRGAAIQLALAGARELVLLNRTRSKAASVARHIRTLHLKTRCAFTPQPCDLAIQATSLGLRPSDPAPIAPSDWDRLRPRFFLDMIYRPAETRCLREARKCGCRVANGAAMLLHQGARAFEIWTGRRAPLATMRRALARELSGRHS